MDCVFVVGMHRSGTSLCASLVQKMGYDPGRTGEADMYNEGGYYEDLELVRINNGILRSLGCSWDRPPSMESIEKHSKIIKEQYQRFFNKEKKMYKDPRISLFLKYALEVVPDAKVVYVVRSESSVARSLFERDGFDENFSKKLKRTYDRCIEDALSERSHLKVHFEDMVSNPQDTVSEISRYLEKDDDAGIHQLVMSKEQKDEIKRKLILENMKKDFLKLFKNPSKIFALRAYRHLGSYIRVLNSRRRARR